MEFHKLKLSSKSAKTTNRLKTFKDTHFHKFLLDREFQLLLVSHHMLYQYVVYL